MLQTLIKLLELQNVDFKLKKLDRAINTLNNKLDEFRELKVKAVQKLRSVETSLKDKREKLRLLECDLRATKERLSSVSSLLDGTGHPKKRKIYQKEKEKLQHQISKLEEKILETLEAEEELLKRRDEVEREVKAEVERIESLGRKFLASVERLKNRRTELLNRRAELVKQIPESVVARYQYLLERRGMPVVVPVGRDRVCKGCHLAIQPQLYNEMHAGNRLFECPNCGRIIYLENL